jgi:hypothetical protein
MREENALGQSGSPSRLSNKVQRPSTPDVLKDDKNEGLYIMQSGVCSIVHKYDQFEVKELRSWDFFGECDLLKVIVSFIIAI